MKICLVTPDLIGPIRNGGIGTYCAHLLKLLHGNELTLVFTAAEEAHADRNWREAYEKRGIRVADLAQLANYAEKRDINPKQDRFLERSWMVYQWLKTQQDGFDLIHFQDWGANGFYSIRAQRSQLAFTNTRITVTVHSPSEWLRQGMRDWPGDTLTQLRLNYAERYCVENAGAVIFPSTHMRDWCQTEGWRIPEEHWIIPCPYLPPQKQAPSANIKPDMGHLVFFGRLEARKGLEVFLQALEQVLTDDSHGINRVSFIGKDGQLGAGQSSRRIQQLAKSFGDIRLDVHTNFAHDEALKYIKESAGVVWIPSRIDNCPYTVIECIENDIPFFASATGGVSEIVDSSRLFPFAAAGIANAIRERQDLLLSRAGHPYSADRINSKWLDWHQQLKPTESFVADIPVSELPWVSVCVPYYNQPEFLPHTLSALKNCPYPNLEVIVVNDGCTDRAAREIWDRMVRRYEQNDWTFFELSTNQGLGAARNMAASKATGDYLIFNDSDNCAFPNMVECFVRAMEHSGADCLTCGFIRHHNKGDPHLTPSPGKVIRPLGNFTLLGLLDNVFGDANLCIRKEVYEAIGGFTEDRETAAHDWELLLRLALEGYEIDVVPTELYWYRHLPNSMMRRADRYQTHMVAIQSWLQKQDSLAARQLLSQLTIPLFHEHQHLQKSWSRLPKFLQRWQCKQRRGKKNPWWRIWG